MGLLLPGFLAATALAALPFILHLLRLDPKRPVPFPTLQFLGREALRDSRRHRLSRWLLLLLRCLLIVAIAVAFARPFWPLAHTADSRAVVVVVDNSTSMQAEGRREAVEAWLAPLLSRLQPPDRLGVLVLGPTPTWRVPLTRDLASAKAALQALPQGFETTRYRSSLDLAGAVLAAAPVRQRQIWLAGDGQRLGWEDAGFDRPLPPGVGLVVAPPAPAPARQAAIVSLRAERADGGRLLLEAAVRGFAPAADTRTVNFYAGDTLLGSRPVSLAAGKNETVRALLPVSSLESALAIRAVLEPSDDLAADDTAYAALAPTDDRSVLLAPPPPGAGFDFLSAAFRSVHGGGLDVFQIRPLPPAGPWPASAIAILRGAAPFRAPAVAALDAFVAEGGPAWILCDGSPEQAAWLARLGITVSAEATPDENGVGLRDLALEHPLFAPFVGHSLVPLLEPHFHRAWKLAGDAAEPLARWPDHGIAIAEVSTGVGRVLVTGFGGTREDSDFPTQVGFVPFVHEAAVWLGKNTLSAPNRGTVSEPLALPGAGTWTAVYGPRKGFSAEVAGTVTPSAPGIYRFRQKGVSRFYAINLDPAESDLAPWPHPADFDRLVSSQAAPLVPRKAAEPVAAFATDVNERDAWWWLLVLAVVVAIAELMLSRRTAR